MNGKTKIDALLNPCTAEMDRRTYGIPCLLNFSTHGNRFIRICFFGIILDFYKCVYKQFFYMRIDNAAAFCTPIGSITWPMPKLRR